MRPAFLLLCSNLFGKLGNREYYCFRIKVGSLRQPDRHSHFRSKFSAKNNLLSNSSGIRARHFHGRFVCVGANWAASAGSQIRSPKRRRVGTLIGGRQPISTSLPDAVWADVSKDGFTPRDPQRSLMTLQRTPNGGFILQPGYYVLVDQSYCLHAGTHGPGGGDGYLYAPPKGSAEDAVISVVRNSVKHPEIQQHDIQLLLWAIVARAKFEDLSHDLKAVAARLLTPRQLAGLNRNALDVLQAGSVDRRSRRRTRSVKSRRAGRGRAAEDAHLRELDVRRDGTCCGFKRSRTTRAREPGRAVRSMVAAPGWILHSIYPERV